MSVPGQAMRPRPADERVDAIGRGVPVTVVIATRNRASTVLSTVERLRALPERPAVVVVDNASDDGTVALLRRRVPDVDVIALPVNQGAAARNLGVRRASTPVVALCDDDSWFDPGSLERACQIFDERPRLGLLAARVLVEPGGWLDPTCRRMAAGAAPSATIGAGPPYREVFGFLACGAVIRRSSFLRVGGFDVSYFIGGEEAPLAIDLWRAGCEVRYAPDVVVHHEPSPLRDREQRRRLLVRNALWTAWTRRPLDSALRTSGRVVADAPASLDTWRGVGAALAAWRAVRRERSPINDDLERRLRLSGQ